MNELPYLAGLLDGEGCIVVSKYRRKDRVGSKDYYCLRIKVANKNYEVINLFREVFGCGSVYQNKQSGVWEWSLTSSGKVKEVLESLLPFLIVKRKQSLAALTFELGDRKPNSDRVKSQAKLKEQIHKLNTVTV